MNLQRIVFIALFFASTLSFAQKSEIGVFAGPSLTTIRSNNIKYYNNRVGFQAGISFNHALTNKSSLNINLFYETKGANGDTDIIFYDNNGNISDIREFKFTDKYDYLMIPIMYGYEFGNKLKFRVQAGPYFGYLLKNSLKEGDAEVVTTDNNKKIDLGISTTLNLLFSINDLHYFKVAIANNYGLKDVNKSESSEANSYKMNSTSLLLGFNFRINK